MLKMLSCVKYVRPSTEIYAKRRHAQCVAVIVISKISSIDDGRLETDVVSASSGLDAVDHNEVLRGPSLE
jgi:hypothetical protein